MADTRLSSRDRLWRVAVVIRRYLPVLIAVAVVAALIVLVPRTDTAALTPAGPQRAEDRVLEVGA